MAGKVMSPEATLHYMDLLSKPYRPQLLLDLKAQIEGETRALEVREASGVPIGPEDIQRVVNMKLELDRLCADWAEGRIS